MDLDGENPLVRLGESKTDIAVFLGLVSIAGVLVFVFLGPRKFDFGVSSEYPIGTVEKIAGFLEGLGAEKNAPVTNGGLTTTTYKLTEGDVRKNPIKSEADLITDRSGRLRRVAVRTVYLDPIDQPLQFSKFGRGFDHYWRSISNQPRVFRKKGAGTDSLYSDFQTDKANGLWIKSPRDQTETITLSRLP